MTVFGCVVGYLVVSGLVLPLVLGAVCVAVCGYRRRGTSDD
jgi:hypothetical protein